MKSYTCKSVRDHNQKAILKDKTIEVISYIGKKEVFRYEFPMVLWLKALGRPFNNSIYNKHELINKYADSRINFVEEYAIRERIIDAQIRAIETIMEC